MTEQIYDWPTAAMPRRVLFRSGGAVEEVSFSASSAEHFTPVVGGKSFLTLEYEGLGAASLKIVSWLQDMLARRALFRIPVKTKTYLASRADLGLDEVPDGGMPWSGGQVWSSGNGWANPPLVSVAEPALEGALTVIVRMGPLRNSLAMGDVIGYFGGIHKIDRVSYAGNVATLTLFTPLRRDLAAGEDLTLRPSLTGRCENPEPFMAMFQYGKWVKPGSITFREALL